MAPPFDELRERLLRAGVAPRHVRRYIVELTDHWADLKTEEESAGRNRCDAEGAASVRLGGMDELLEAMVRQRQLQSWCVRAPWMAFGLMPLVFLLGAYVVACLVLWSGWRIFLPSMNTPFVPVHGWAILYFGVGRWIYYGAPVLIGWIVCLVAARQRIRLLWPASGLVLIALLGCMSQIHATGPGIQGESGHIHLNFSLGSSAQSMSASMNHALIILSLTVLPWMLWQLQRERLRSL